jgi:hypothetical protein
LKNLLINSLDSHQVFVLEDKPFPYGTLCHCEKCIGFGLFCLNLALLGSLLSHSFLHILFAWMRYIFEHVCFISSFVLDGSFLVHLLNFVEQIFCDLHLWYNLDNKFVWWHLYALFDSFGVLSKVYLSWIFKVFMCAYM